MPTCRFHGQGVAAAPSLIPIRGIADSLFDVLPGLKPWRVVNREVLANPTQSSSPTSASSGTDPRARKIGLTGSREVGSHPLFVKARFALLAAVQVTGAGGSRPREDAGPISRAGGAIRKANNMGRGGRARWFGIGPATRVAAAALSIAFSCTVGLGGVREAAEARSKARPPRRETPPASPPREPSIPAIPPGDPAPGAAVPAAPEGAGREDDAPPPGTGAYEHAPEVSENRPAPPRAAGAVKAEDVSREREFPWPPIKASSKEELPDRAFRQTRTERVLVSDIITKLGLALLDVGYLSRSYLAVPEGFALVTRLERIRPDGTPYPEAGRWLGEKTPIREFRLSSYVEALSGAEPGLYRVLAFVVRPGNLVHGTRIDPSEKAEWLKDDLNRVPPSVSEYAYAAGYRCGVFVFEFEKGSSGERARPRIPGRLPALAHLQAAGIWGRLGK